MKATNVVSLCSSSHVVKKVTYRQNRENEARMQVTMILGVPSHTRIFDSLSYFFITASRSIGACCNLGSLFFLENNKANSSSGNNVNGCDVIRRSHCSYD